jgi:hypothetical protein
VSDAKPERDRPHVDDHLAIAAGLILAQNLLEQMRYRGQVPSDAKLDEALEAVGDALHRGANFGRLIVAAYGLCMTYPTYEELDPLRTEFGLPTYREMMSDLPRFDESDDV